MLGRTTHSLIGEYSLFYRTLLQKRPIILTSLIYCVWHGNFEWLSTDYWTSSQCVSSKSCKCPASSHHLLSSLSSFLGLSSEPANVKSDDFSLDLCGMFLWADEWPIFSFSGCVLQLSLVYHASFLKERESKKEKEKEKEKKRKRERVFQLVRVAVGACCSWCVLQLVRVAVGACCSWCVLQLVHVAVVPCLSC